MTRQHMVHKGDCLELMKLYKPQSFDMILCDLPYGTTACKWDTVIPFAPLWQQYERLIKSNGAIILFASQPFTSVLITNNIKLFKYCWVWNKNLGTGHLRAKFQPLKQHEDICVFGKGTINYYPQMTKGKGRMKGSPDYTDGVYGQRNADRIPQYSDMYYPKSIIEFSNANHGDRLHPTQKPISVLEYLIRTYTNENEIVLDNTMGSGSTGVACANTRRRFIGMEQDENYFNIAQKRCADAFTEWENE